MATLYELASDYQAVIDGCFIYDPETGEILFDGNNIDDLKDSVNSKLENIALYIKNQSADIDAIDAEIKRLQDRKRVKKNKVERLKEYALEGMDIADIDKVETPRVAISLRFSQRVEITDEQALRECAHEVFIPQPDKVDKAMLRKILKNTDNIEGAELVYHMNIQIK